MPFEGMTIQEMINYIQGACHKKGYDINQETIITFLNQANLEFEFDSGFTLSHWTKVTEADINYYELPSDINYIDDVFIVETGEDGGKPLARATIKQIKATLNDDSLDETVEP